MTLFELATKRELGLKAWRRLDGQLFQLTNVIMERLEPFVEVEFARLPENERLAALDGVADVLESRHFSDDAVLTANLDENAIIASLSKIVFETKANHLLSVDAQEYFDLILRETVAHLAEIAITLPSFQGRTLKELLARDSEIISLLREVLERMPRRESRRALTRSQEFKLTFDREMTRFLDRVEIFGVTQFGPSRKYSLNIAYIGLTLDAKVESETDTAAKAPGQVVELGHETNIENAVASCQYLYIRGEAGSGKTTLLRWLALQSVTKSHTRQLYHWNKVTPFLVELRRFAKSDLPGPQELLKSLPRHVSDRSPDGWVHDVLESGSGAILLDGVDEFPADRRPSLRRWIESVAESYPGIPIVVTSRPSATPSDWLNSLSFVSADLLPMSRAHVASFVSHWHSAISREDPDEHAIEKADAFRRSMLAALTRSHPLRQLASNPLLCALLCALNWERRQQLPKSRISIYRTALEMLLYRRDHERTVAYDAPPMAEVGMQYEDMITVLGALAYWFTLTGQADADERRVVAKVGKTIKEMPGLDLTGEEAYRALLARSGVLREPTPGRVDFIHKSFQEYLAAIRCLEEDSIEELLKNSTRDSYREVIVMACGCARPKEAEAIIGQLLTQSSKARISKARKSYLHLLAVSCLEVTKEYSIELKARVYDNVASLTPPSSLQSARVLATLGDDVFKILPTDVRSLSERTAIATLNCAAIAGSPPSNAIFQNAALDTRASIRKALLSLWGLFDPTDYACTVLNRAEGHEWRLQVSDPYVLGGLSSVKKIKSLECSFSGPIGGEELEPLDASRALVSLAIRDNPRIVSLQLIPHMSRLRGLRLVNCPNLQLIEGLAQARYLSVLEIDGIPVELSSDSIENFVNLRSLRIHDSLALASPRILRNFGRLQRLDLGGRCGVGSTGSLGYSSSLGTLILSRCLELRQVNGLGSLTKLQRLVVRDCPELESLWGIADAADSLSELTISDVEHLPDFRFIGTLRNLRSLRLERCTIDRLDSLLNLNQLEVLHIEECTVENVVDLSPLTRRGVEIRGLSPDGQPISAHSVLHDLGDTADHLDIEGYLFEDQNLEIDILLEEFGIDD
nr:NACHT domain-containing protein [Pseudonocardia pini]